MTIEFRCLHGTLQTAEVWKEITALLGERLAEFSSIFLAEDLLALGRQAKTPGDWSRTYCATLSEKGPRVARVLVGYSLGGRLGLHALLACPPSWDAAIIVAGHPGDASSVDRAASRRRDAGWAARLRDDDLEAVLADWDSLPVFCGRPNPVPRAPEALSAERWAAAFQRYSRGNQADLRAPLAHAPLPPVLYVSGELDARYTAIGDELARVVTGLRHISIRGAAHRVPWERPEAFADAVAAFIRLTLPRAHEDGAG